MKFKPKATPPLPPLTLDKESDYISLEPDRIHKELIVILESLQKRFVPHSEFHNQLTKAIKLANQ
jgi:hypothetical protein